MEELQRRANEKYRMAKVYAKCTVCVYDVCADTCVCVCMCVFDVRVYGVYREVNQNCLYQGQMTLPCFYGNQETARITLQE